MFFFFSFDFQSLGTKNFTLGKVLKILKEYTFLFILLSRKFVSMPKLDRTSTLMVFFIVLWLDRVTFYFALLL